MRTKTLLGMLTVGMVTAITFGSYVEPLPAGMAENRTFLDGQLATGWWTPATTGSWSKGAIGGGVTGIGIMNYTWENSIAKNGAYVEWNDVNVAVGGSYEIWLSSYVTSNIETSGSYLSGWTVQAGTDSTNFRTLITSAQVVYPGYDMAASWVKLSDVELLSTDKFLRLTFVSNNTYQSYELGVDEIVLATSVPEPMTLGLLACGSVALFRRRK